MPDYKASNELAGTKQAIGSSFKTLMTITAASATALRRIKVDDAYFGVEGTPSDQPMVWDVARAGLSKPVAFGCLIDRWYTIANCPS